MLTAPIKEYRLTLECNGRTKTATVTHDLYGREDHTLALKDLHAALAKLIFLHNEDPA